jgi:hypothetical protein
MITLLKANRRVGSKTTYRPVKEHPSLRRQRPAFLQVLVPQPLQQSRLWKESLVHPKKSDGMICITVGFDAENYEFSRVIPIAKQYSTINFSLLSATGEPFRKQ